MTGRLPAPFSYLARDRLLLGVTVLAAVVVALPLFQSPILPVMDLGAHVGLAAQLPRLLFGDEVAGRYYELNAVPGHHLSVYVFLALSNAVVGPFVAAKLVVFVALVLPTLGLMRLLGALGRSPRLALWAFSLAWDFNMSLGFVAVNIGTGLALWFIGSLLEQFRRDALTGRGLSAPLALGVLVGFTHVQAALLAFTLASGLFVVELRRRRRTHPQAARLVLVGALPGLLLVPWFVHWLSRAPRAPDLLGIALFPDVATRASQLFLATLDVANTVWARNIGGAVYLTLLLVPLLYGMLVTGPSLTRRRALALYLGSWALYLTLPERISWPAEHVLVEQRFAIVVLLLGLTTVPGRFRGKRLWLLAPGLVMIGLSATVALWQVRAFKPHVRGFLPIAGSIEPGRKVTAVLWQIGTPESVRFTLSHVPGYLAARGSYYPYLLSGVGLPVDYKKPSELPEVPNLLQPAAFQPLVHARGFDYVLVQGTRPLTSAELADRDAHDERRKAAQRSRGKGGQPLRPWARKPELEFPEYLARSSGLVVQLETRSGIWQLYSVKEAPYRPPGSRVAPRAGGAPRPPR